MLPFVHGISSWALLLRLPQVVIKFSSLSLVGLWRLYWEFNFSSRDPVVLRFPWSRNKMTRLRLHTSVCFWRHYPVLVIGLKNGLGRALFFPDHDSVHSVLLSQILLLRARHCHLFFSRTGAGRSSLWTGRGCSGRRTLLSGRWFGSVTRGTLHGGKLSFKSCRPEQELVWHLFVSHESSRQFDQGSRKGLCHFSTCSSKLTLVALPGIEYWIVLVLLGGV